MSNAKFLIGQPPNLNIKQKVRLILKILRAEFPVEHPVKFRFVDLDAKKIFGYVSLYNQNRNKAKKYFVMSINKSTSWGIIVDTIIHEYAHIMSWYLSKNDHDRQWAICYAKIYRRLIED